MDYRRIYNEFIDDRWLKQNTLTEEFEIHHIIPRAYKESSNKPPNLIKLTYSDHVFTHLLLAKFLGGPMIAALNVMINCKRYKGRTTRKIYQSNRQKFAKRMSGENNPMYGRSGENSPSYGIKRSEEFKEKIKTRMSGENNPMFGKTGENHPIHRIKRSKGFNKGKNNPMYGKIGKNHPMYGKKGKDNPKAINHKKRVNEAIGDPSKYTDIEW